MNYNIKGTGLAITDELRGYLEKKLEHAGKFLEGDSTALTMVELEHAPLNDGGKYRAELITEASGKTFRASQWGGTMHEAIDLAAGELTGELRRSKKQKLKVFRHSAVRVKEFLRGWRNKI